MSTLGHRVPTSSPGHARQWDTTRYRDWIARHQVASFFVGAYAFSWLFWTPSMLGVQSVAVSVAMVVGFFGPALSSVLMTRLGGGSARSWFRGLFRWRVPARWYAFALGFPLLYVAVASTVFVLAGESLKFSLLGGNLAKLLPLLVFGTLLGGGNEEPGWRGFALPRLQTRWTPIRATLLLGTVWALWHLPIFVSDGRHGLDAVPFALVLLVRFVGIAAGYAVPLTLLYNKTQSPFLCMLLHGSINAAVGVLILVPTKLEGTTYATLSFSINATVVAVSAVLLLVTHGRLGLDARGTSMSSALSNIRN